MPSIAALSTALLLVAVAAMETRGYSMDEPGAYLTESDGHKVLKDPLTVREEQDGINGVTGWVWTVEPSGEWKVSKLKRGRGGTDVLTPIRSGKASAAEVEELAKSLARREFSGLPEKLGRAAKVNSHKIVIQFGKKTSTLEGLPTRRGTSVADLIRKSAAQEKADAGVLERFASIAEAVESRCVPKEKSP